MKNRMRFVVLAAVAVVVVLAWAVARNQKNPVAAIPASVATPTPVLAANPTSVPMSVLPSQPAGVAANLPVPRQAASDVIRGRSADIDLSRRPKLAVAETSPRNSDANDPEPQTQLRYTASAGDTLTNLAHAFLGSGSQAHQDSIIDVNPSLQGNADHIVAGKAYTIPAPDGLSAGAAGEARIDAKTRPQTDRDSDDVIAAGATRSLRYTARPGDTVTTMAVQLLGSDTQETRDAIIRENPSLKQDPDRVIAGRTYWIPAPTAAE